MKPTQEEAWTCQCGDVHELGIGCSKCFDFRSEWMPAPEVAGLKAELTRLREQLAAAVDRKAQELEARNSVNAMRLGDALVRNEALREQLARTQKACDIFEKNSEACAVEFEGRMAAEKERDRLREQLSAAQADNLRLTALCDLIQAGKIRERLAALEEWGREAAIAIEWFGANEGGKRGKHAKELVTRAQQLGLGDVPK